MLTVQKDIPDFVFSSALSVFQFYTTSQARFKLVYGDITLIDESYVPDAAGNVTIADIDNLLFPYIEINPSMILTYTISNISGESISKTFNVQLCNFNIAISAAAFVSQYFLNAMAGRDKVTAISRKEFLSVREKESTASSIQRTYFVEATYVDASGHIINRTFNTKGAGYIGQTQRIDVSPVNYMIDGLELLKYSVVCADRRQTFILDIDNPECTTVRFRNSFGAMENFYFTGTRNIEPEISRQTAYINGTFSIHTIEENRIYKANTGNLTENMLELADDLARSKEVYLIENNNERAITITESETKQSNDDDAMYNFLISYRYSSRYQSGLPLLVNVFDETFDETFN